MANVQRLGFPSLFGEGSDKIKKSIMDHFRKQKLGIIVDCTHESCGLCEENEFHVHIKEFIIT